MDQPLTRSVEPSDVRAFIEELLRGGLMLTEVLASLIEAMPDDAYPGEEKAEVLLEMLTGSVLSTADAAGRTALLQAKALIGAVCDKALADLREAAALAAQRSLDES